MRMNLGVFAVATIPLWVASCLCAQPTWYTAPGTAYPPELYLVGVGASSAREKADRLQIAGDSAIGALVSGIRTHVSALVSSETTESQGAVSVSALSRVSSSVSLEVDGIQIVRREDEKRTAYAIAVLDREEAREIHRQKATRLAATIAEELSKAEKYEADEQIDHALAAYTAAQSLAAQLNDALAVLTVLSRSNGNGLIDLGDLGKDRRAEIVRRIDQLGSARFSRISGAAAMIAQRLEPQLRKKDGVLILPPTFKETRFQSEFSRAFASELSRQLLQIGIENANDVGLFRPQSSDYLTELGKASGSGAVLSGVYQVDEGEIRIAVEVTEVATRRKIAVSEARIDTLATTRADLDVTPQNLEQAVRDAGVFADGEMLPAGLGLEIWTDRGSRSVILEEGEEITMAIRVTQPAYLQVVYHLANGMRVLLYNDLFIDAAKVNKVVALPDTFVVSPPLGVEVLHAFASNEEFGPLSVVNWEGYEVLQEDVSVFVERTRGLRKKVISRQVAESRLTITTIPGQ
jgi:hypothetical protein